MMYFTLFSYESKLIYNYVFGVFTEAKLPERSLNYGCIDQWVTDAKSTCRYTLTISI